MRAVGNIKKQNMEGSRVGLQGFKGTRGLKNKSRWTRALWATGHNIRGKRWSECAGEGVPEEPGRRSICLHSGLWDDVSLCLAGWWRYGWFPTVAITERTDPTCEKQNFSSEMFWEVSGAGSFPSKMNIPKVAEKYVTCCNLGFFYF